MPKKSGLITEREREICSRVYHVREQIRWSQIDFATGLGISRAKLISIEAKQTPLRCGLALRICRIYNVKAKWLASGQGDIYPHNGILWSLVSYRKIKENELFSIVFDSNQDLFDPIAKLEKPPKEIPDEFDFLRSIDEFIWLFCGHLKFKERADEWNFVLKLLDFLKKESSDAVRNERAERTIINLKTRPFHILGSSGSASPQNPAFTDVSILGNVEAVKAKLPALIKRLNEATRERGSKSRLAEFMGVPLPKISQWLSGEHEPGGENTLQLLQWVKQQERQK